MAPFERIGSLLSDELMKVLDECFPHRCASPTDTEREIWMKAGERRVVDILLSKLSEFQDESILT